MKERRSCRGWIAERRFCRGDAALRPRQTGQKAISIVATDSNQPPKRTEAARTVQLPAANPVRYTYDANGNLLSDGVWTYAWTTECRLVRAEGGNLKAEYVYDGEGRRRSKKVFSWDPQTENWSLLTEHLFLYDGRNPICETTTDHTQTPVAVSAKGSVQCLPNIMLLKILACI